MKKFTTEKSKNKTVYYRNGEPMMVSLSCPNPDDKDLQNVIILQRVNKISPMDILASLLGGLSGKIN